MGLGKRSLSRVVIYLWEPSLILVCATLCVILADELESVTRIVVPYILLFLCGSEGIKSHYLTQPHLFSNSWRTEHSFKVLLHYTSGLELPKVSYKVYFKM